MPIARKSSPCIRLIGAGMFVGLLLSGVPQTSFAQSCVQDLYGKNLQCTANDVRIAYAVPGSVKDPKTGSSIVTCVAGSRFDFVATFNVVTTATARENIGMYFAKDGQASALTGGPAGAGQLTCADNVITPLHDNPVFPTTTYAGAPQLGTSQYEELDTATPKDSCGDISTSDNNQLINVYVTQALCKAGADGNVALPNCTSWQQPGGTNLCQYTNDPAFGYPYGTNGALPGSPSKCNCDNSFTIPVTVQDAKMTVAKTCTVGSKPASDTCKFDGTMGTNLEGGAVTYGLSITNTSNIGDVIVDEVCDSIYGGLYTSSTYSHCTASTTATAASNTCKDKTAPWTIDGTASTCSFVETVGELANVSDIITVYAHGASSGMALMQASNSVTVTSGDNPSTATITAGVTSPTANTTFCTDVTYNVGASNTSTTDESPVTLTTLSEGAVPLGDLTKVSSTVLATSCSVPQALAIGADPYTCAFRTHICGTLAPVVKTPGTCNMGVTPHVCSAGKDSTTSCTQNSDCDVSCNGIQQSISVSANAHGDEGVNDTANITVTPGTKTVTACVDTAVF